MELLELIEVAFDAELSRQTRALRPPSSDMRLVRFRHQHSGPVLRSFKMPLKVIFRNTRRINYMLGILQMRHPQKRVEVAYVNLDNCPQLKRGERMKGQPRVKAIKTMITKLTNARRTLKNTMREMREEHYSKQWGMFVPKYSMPEKMANDLLALTRKLNGYKTELAEVERLNENRIIKSIQ